MKLFPSNHEKMLIISIVSFCSGAVFGVLSDVDKNTVIGAAATLIAAFSGAYFAYRFSSERERKKKKEVDLVSANRVIFNMVRAYNQIAGFNRQFVRPHKESPAAYLEIKPSLGVSNIDLKIDYDSISFLISEGKAEILTELTEFEELFLIFLETVERRNQIHLNIVQPAMEAAGFIQGSPVSLEEADGIIGARVSNIIKNLTFELIRLAQHGEDKSEKLIGELHKVMSGIFVGENVIKMKKIEKQR